MNRQSPPLYSAADPGLQGERPDRCLADAFGAVFPPAWSRQGWSDTVAVCVTGAAQWQSWLQQAAALLDATEAARVRRRRVAADRELLTVTYALHRMLLGRLLRRDPREVPLYRDARGCPRLADGLGYTSLSHADGLVALAFSADGPVGIDIERRQRAHGLSAIADRVCHPLELSALAGTDSAGRCTELLRLWVRKEALLKAAGVGLAVEMNTFLAVDSQLDSFPGAVASHVQMLDVGDAAVAALAAPCGTHADFHWLRPCVGIQADLHDGHANRNKGPRDDGRQ